MPGTSDAFKKASLNLSRGRRNPPIPRGNPRGSGFNSPTKNFNDQDKLALAKSLTTNNGKSLGQKLQGEAGKQAGRYIGGALGSEVPVVGTAIGAKVGATIGKYFGEAPLWKKALFIIIPTFISFLPLILIFLMVGGFIVIIFTISSQVNSVSNAICTATNSCALLNFVGL